MVGITVEARKKRLQKFFDNIQNIDLVALHSDLGEEGRNIIEGRFDSGRDPTGKPWKPIKRYFNRDYNQWRLPSDTPLKLKDLYKSFSYDASADEVVIGTPKKYAKYHTNFPNNNGAPRRKIPLREFMGFESAQDVDILLDVVEDHVENAMNV